MGDTTQQCSQLASILARCSDADALIEQLQCFLSTTAFPCADVGALLALASAEPRSKPGPVATALRLFEAELLLYFGSGALDHRRIDSIFKSLSYLAVTSQAGHGESGVLTRIKYNDLLTDYQFLLSPQATQLRLMDLVTKKINILALKPSATTMVVEQIQSKILVYYLLCDSDFRTSNVYKYLCSEGIVDRVRSSEIVAYLSYKDRLIPVQEYTSLVAFLRRNKYYMSLVLELREQDFFKNYLDANLSKLPNYYSCIRLSRVLAYFPGFADVSVVEDLLYQMIVSGKFSYGATIDQIGGAVYFKQRPTKYSDFDAHVKTVCDTVDAIASASSERRLEEKSMN